MKGVVILVKVDEIYNILKNVLATDLAKRPYKRFVETSFKYVDAFSTCFDFERVAANHRHVIRKRNR